MHTAPNRTEAGYVSHPPLRPVPPLASRPKADGPGRYVDPARGDDANHDGSEPRPWRTINHALSQLGPGDTLYLRGGIYHEQVYCAVAGTAEQPITIRSYPDERAIIQGGLPEFFHEPENAWEPCTAPDAGPQEYRSTKPYRNVRDVLGLFGDSMIGLQTYWYAEDLRAENELWIADPDEKMMVLPVYCGPGLWYDKVSGHIHARLAHTRLECPYVTNYEGVTDPRQVPMIVAPFSSTPLFVDQAMHVRFEDLVIRGGGYNTVVMHFGVDVTLDGVIVYGGTYCMRARNTGPLKMTNSALYGQIPPWAFRSENSLHSRYHRPFLDQPELAEPNRRNIARLPTHAVLVTEGFEADQVFAYPVNHTWDVSYCEFSDGHDGAYVTGKNIHFHHNLVDRFQDDAIYLSSPSPTVSDNVHVHENLITQSLLGFGYHNRGGPEGDIYIYRNIVDNRVPAPFGRPTPEQPQGDMRVLHVHVIHGYELFGMESLHYYQNTFVSWVGKDAYAHRTLLNTSERTRRWVLNNLFVYLPGNQQFTQLTGAREVEQHDPNAEHEIVVDGNLHHASSPAVIDEAGLRALLEEARRHPGSQRNRTLHPPGWESQSMVAEPGFVRFGSEPEAVNDYRLSEDSPARGAGVVLPAAFPDPLRPAGDARPDIGALPFGSELMRVGIRGRYVMPFAGCVEPSA